MTDVFSRRKRSEVMARIRSKNTTPEMAVRRALHAMGFRFRLHDGRLPGRPDIVMRRHGLVVDVKGCFWHGHRCLKGRLPVTNRSYWLPKLEGNRRRDQRNRRALRRLGWRVVTIWECDVRKLDGEELLRYLRSGCLHAKYARSAAPSTTSR